MPVYDLLHEQFNVLTRALSRHGHFVPASALDEVTEEQRPADLEQRDDDEVFASVRCYNIERATDLGYPYVSLPAPDDWGILPDLRAFVDGAVRTYRWGELIDTNNSFPLMVTQYGAAASVTQNYPEPYYLPGVPGACEPNKRVRIALARRRIAVLVPSSPPLSETTWSALSRVARGLSHDPDWGITLVPLDQPLRNESSMSMYDALATKARRLMRDLELQVAVGMAQRMENDEEQNGAWLVADGALRAHAIEETGRLMERAMGVAKSFSLKPVFSINGSPPRSLVAVLEHLQPGQRTVVFKRAAPLDRVSNDPLMRRVERNVAFWYLRLRRGGGSAKAPLGGIVKLDIRFAGNRMEEADRVLVDGLSQSVLAASAVTSFPLPRWETHLYPIYAAESYLKQVLYSPALMRAVLLG